MDVEVRLVPILLFMDYRIVVAGCINLIVPYEFSYFMS